MKIRNKSLLRMVTMGMAVILLLVSLPCCALADSFSAVVKSKQMKVYGDAQGSWLMGKLPKKTVVTVTDYANGVARISYNGYTGYVWADDLVAVESIATKAMTTVDTYAYKKPNPKSAHVKVDAGTIVNVLAVKGGAAMVEKNGVVAYMYAKHLITKEQWEANGGQVTPEVPQKSETSGSKVPSFMNAYKSGNFSNEQLCYLFLTQVMGYNNAATAGVLANIHYESGFKTAINGDGGTSYGICQWHASRKTRLLNYCAENDVSADSLLGQLAYLKYELENYYPSVHRYLKSVSNTAQGAYDAGYYFCYNFEAPASKGSKSVTRGNSAKNTYFARYASI